jgi:hypothetical protein
MTGGVLSTHLELVKVDRPVPVTIDKLAQSLQLFFGQLRVECVPTAVEESERERKRMEVSK